MGDVDAREGQRLGHTLALEGVDQPGCVTGQDEPSDKLEESRWRSA